MALAPSSYVFIKRIHLENRNVFARFDEIPLFKIYRKLPIQKPFRITKGDNSNSICPSLKIGMCLQGLIKFQQNCLYKIH